MKNLKEFIPFLVKDGGFVIYCGAGISIPSPSCAPSWWTLTEEILEAFFNRAPAEWGVPKDLIIKDENKQPEAIFESFANVLEGRFYKIFDSLNVTEPNAVHIAIARLAKSGLLKACITTNFDIFIERALKQEHVPFKLLVDNSEFDEYNKSPGQTTFLLCKIHGTIERPESIVSVASAYKSNKGFSTPKEELVSTLLVKYPFLFLGYSGWDFNHLNYRRYWERMGPKLKAIFWNMRPQESTSVKFKEIFETSWNKFEFIEGDLPLDLVESIKIIKDKKISTDSMKVISSEESNKFFNNAKNKRLEFFKQWTLELPLPHTLGLVMSQSFLFSQQFKDMMNRFKEVQGDKESIKYTESTDTSAEIMKLSGMLSRGEITAEEFQTQQNRLTLRLQMKYIRKSHQDIIIKEIELNKRPGITDDQTIRSLWLGYITSLSQNFELEDTLKYATEIAFEYKETMKSYDKNSQANMIIIGFKPSLLHPNEKLWKPYYTQMLQVKEKFLRDEIDYTQYAGDLSKILMEQNKAKMGLTVPLGPLATKLIDTIASIKSDQELIESLEVLLLTMDFVGSWLMADVMQQKAFTDHYHKLTQKFAENQIFPIEEMTAIDSLLKSIYQPILDRIGRMKTPKTAQILVELTILGRWKDLMQAIGGNFESFSKQWDEGRYPIRMTHERAYLFLKEMFTPWLDAGLTSLSHRVIQKMVKYIIGIAENGQDFELIKRMTLKSLELTENVVTEATPQEVPGVMAAFLDLNNDHEEALQYYEMALDAMKTVVPPMYQDAILYRSTSLMNEFSEKYPKKEILKTIGKFHPAFYGNQLYASSGSPATDLTIKLAEQLAKNEGFSNAKEAITELLGY